MIPVSPAEEPSTFDSQVREPGRRVLQELVGISDVPRRGRKRKPVATSVEEIPASALRTKSNALWRRALPDLRRAYRDQCAYLAMRIHPAHGAATVDHFQPLAAHPELAYEWSNFRLAASQVNSNKSHHQDVLDPFQIQEGWFVLDIATFEVRPGSDLSPARHDAVQATIERLKLNDPTFKAARAEYHDRYLGLAGDPPLPVEWLDAECPFVAMELRRQGRISSEAK